MRIYMMNNKKGVTKVGRPTKAKGAGCRGRWYLGMVVHARRPSPPRLGVWRDATKHLLSFPTLVHSLLALKGCNCVSEYFHIR